jgi:hypothetical protein
VHGYVNEKKFESQAGAPNNSAPTITLTTPQPDKRRATQKSRIREELFLPPLSSSVQNSPFYKRVAEQ